MLPSPPLGTEQNTELLSGVWTYFAVFFAFFLANVNVMTSLLGLVLLMVRLIYELPKATATIRSMFTKKDKIE